MGRFGMQTDNFVDIMITFPSQGFFGGLGLWPEEANTVPDSKIRAKKESKKLKNICFFI